MSTPRQVSHLLADEGHAVRARGDIYIFKVRASQTDGHYSLFEARNEPGGGIPAHFHTLDEETFYVLEGTYEFRVGDDIINAGPGECIHVPRPPPHALRNIGSEHGRPLLVISPGGYHERYFDEAWDAITDANETSASEHPPDMARIAVAVKKAGLEMVPDPPGASPFGGRGPSS